MFNWEYVTFSIRDHEDGLTNISVTMERIKTAVVKRQLEIFLKFLHDDTETKTEMGITGKITIHESAEKEVYLAVPNQFSKENHLPRLLQMYFSRHHLQISAIMAENNFSVQTSVPKRKSPRIIPSKDKLSTATSAEPNIPKRKKKIAPKSVKSKKLKKNSDQVTFTDYFSENIKTFWNSQPPLRPILDTPNKESKGLQNNPLSYNLFPFSKLS